eukprot:TRINITY_DN9340_c0_g1_i1.p1 TRINITY_DN9340_c0_g1~~TRINITY_DN9340_c0_g1_i1.p1  ORF type:complete len:474 (+),score=101.36 TRINITY_DN9340_c0_g1_i1:239-1660(+)
MKPAAMYLREMIKMMETQLKDAGPVVPQGFTVRLAAQQLCGAGHMDMDELTSVAALSGFDVEDLGLLQLAYEASARCTSVVANQKDGSPLHARTLDWGAMFLRDLAIQVNFQRGGVTVYTAATWAGYLGVLTGCSHNRFSISVNYRSLKGTLIENFTMGLRGGWPVGFLVRSVLEDEVKFPDYSTARAHLASTPLMSPTYFVITGIQPDQASSITRNRGGEEPDKCQDLSVGPITMTNVDLLSRQQHRDTRQSSPRRVCAVFYLKDRSDRFDSAQSAWELLHTPPINNTITLYATVMCAATGVVECRVPIPHESTVLARSDSQSIQLVPRSGSGVDETLSGQLARTSSSTPPTSCSPSAGSPTGMVGIAVLGKDDGYIGRPHYSQEQLASMPRERAEAVLKDGFATASPRSKAGSKAGRVDAEQWAQEWQQYRDTNSPTPSPRNSTSPQTTPMNQYRDRLEAEENHLRQLQED